MSFSESASSDKPASPADERPVLGLVHRAQHPLLTTMLMELLAAAHVGICVCDQHDQVRYANDAWRSAFFPDIPDGPITFAVALADAIGAGLGTKLQSMNLEDFTQIVTARRKAFAPSRNFSVDLTDGRWLWVNEYKLPNGWILSVGADVSEMKGEEFRLREAHAAALKDAQTDPLTGISNRRQGMQQAETLLAEAKRDDQPFSLAILALDHFKRINDTHGHDWGDAVLVQFARLISANAEGPTIVSRIGGEEFLMVTPGLTGPEAKRRLVTLMETLPSLRTGIGAAPLLYSFSAGVATARKDEDLKDVLSRADAALYRAKLNGRTRVEISRAGNHIERIERRGAA